MRLLAKVSLIWLAMALIFTVLVQAQEAESLGDVARQTRKQNQLKAALSKDAQDGDGKSTLSKTPKVITNEEIPEHPDESPVSSAASSSSGSAAAQGSPSGGSKPSAEQWKSEIQAQQNVVTALKTDIERLERSIQFAPGNCASGCVQWNERQKHKQEQVEHMKEDLQQQQNRLDTMQESARGQDYGSSVYEP